MQHFHFLGICGTAMGAVAAAMARKGYTVTGSDAKIYPPMSDFLAAENIRMFDGYAASNIPMEADVIVVGNAMSRGNLEVEAVLERRLYYVSLPEVMKEHFLRGKKNYVVTGTHGKTTTTSMLAWIMEYAGKDPSFMIGGIANNLKRGGRFTDSEFCVLEGDEYDTAFFDKRSKFLHYLPEVVIVNNIEFDHADIYNNVEEIKKSFRHLLRVVPRNGLALVNADDPNCLDLTRSCEDGKPVPCPVQTLGFSKDADIRISDVEYKPEGCAWKLEGYQYELPMIGEFNVRNASMAIKAARFAGIPQEIVAESLRKFEGVARRQQERGEVDGIIVVDDFAHHPTAIKHAVTGLRQRYPGARIWGVFEPRSNTTMRKIFQNELALALATADRPVVSALENKEKISKEDQLDIDKLGNDLEALGRQVFIGQDVPAIVKHIQAEAQSGDVVLVMSNGGFDGIHGKLLEAFKDRKQA